MICTGVPADLTTSMVCTLVVLTAQPAGGTATLHVANVGTVLVGVVTAATLVTAVPKPEACNCTLISRLAFEPAAAMLSVVLVQVTTVAPAAAPATAGEPVGVQVQPAVVAAVVMPTKLTPAGMYSVTVKPVAVDEPALVKVMA